MRAQMLAPRPAALYSRYRWRIPESLRDDRNLHRIVGVLGGNFAGFLAPAIRGPAASIPAQDSSRRANRACLCPDAATHPLGKIDWRAGSRDSAVRRSRASPSYLLILRAPACEAPQAARPFSRRE